MRMAWLIDLYDILAYYMNDSLMLRISIVGLMIADSRICDVYSTHWLFLLLQYTARNTINLNFALIK